jgi:hypothetical protein
MLPHRWLGICRLPANHRRRRRSQRSPRRHDASCALVSARFDAAGDRVGPIVAPGHSLNLGTNDRSLHAHSANRRAIRPACHRADTNFTGISRSWRARWVVPQGPSCLPRSAASFIRLCASHASGPDRDLSLAHGPDQGTAFPRVHARVMQRS